MLLDASAMPPKKSKQTGKGKPSSLADGLSTSEMSKDQLWDLAVQLQEELDREREKKRYFQLERDKLCASWNISKMRLEVAKAQLKRKQQERAEAKERHREEITVYEQKLKHMLSEHQNTISQMKMDNIASTSLTLNQHTKSELKLASEKHGLQANLREKQQQHQAYIKELQLKNQAELIELKNDYDRRIRETLENCEKEEKTMIEEHNKKLAAEITELNERMKSREKVLIEEHDKACRNFLDTYSKIHESMKIERKKVEKELAELTNKQKQAAKQLSGARQHNEHLRESLQKAEQRQTELRKHLEDYEKAKPKMARSRAQVKVMDKELRDLTVEHELLRQAVEKAEKKRDEMVKKQTQAILDIQQKGGYKLLLLEKKVAALEETLEMKEAQLCALLSVSSADPSTASEAEKRLKEIMESKKASLCDLKCELAQDCQKYDNLLHTCRERLKALGIPLWDFPFKPSKQMLKGHTQAKNSSGPSAKQ